MVARSWRSGAAALAIALLLLICLPLVSALGQGLGPEGDFDIREEFRVELNATGDAAITDTLFYDKEWFAEYGSIFEENPNLLTRRYRSDSNVGEVEDFDVDIDIKRATIVVSFTTPGLAYRLQDGWTLFGYGNYELKGEGEGELSLSAAWTISNEFSLFDPMDLDETVTIVLPEGAEGAEFNKSSGAITYDLPYKAKGNALHENKLLFTIIFALLIALSLLLLLVLLMRRGKASAPVQAAGAGTAAPQQATPQTIAAPAAPGAAPPQAAPAPPQTGAVPPQAVPATPETGMAEPPQQAPPQTAGAPATPEAPAPQAVPAPPQAAPVPPQTAAAPPQQAQQPRVEMPAAARFCKKCGHPRGGPEERFCKKCGTPFE